MQRCAATRAGTPRNQYRKPAIHGLVADGFWILTTSVHLKPDAPAKSCNPQTQRVAARLQKTGLSRSDDDNPTAILLLDADWDVKKRPNDCGVCGCVRRWMRSEQASALAERHRQQQLVGEVRPDRYGVLKILLNLVDGFFGHNLGWFAAVAKSRHHFGDVLRACNDAQGVAGAHHLRRLNAFLTQRQVPAGDLEFALTDMLREVADVGHSGQLNRAALGQIES
jgi:hypothetical protein